MHTIVWCELLVVFGWRSTFHVSYKVLTVATDQHRKTCILMHIRHHGLPFLYSSASDEAHAKLAGHN